MPHLCNGCDTALPHPNAPCPACGEALGTYTDDGLDPADRPLSPAVAALAGQYASNAIERETAVLNVCADLLDRQARRRAA